MSHIVHPYSHRLVILRDWKSRWFAHGKKYRELLRSDILVREYLAKKLHDKNVSSIEFEHGRKETKIILKTSRPGMIIGRNGEGAKQLREDLLKEMKRLKINIPEKFDIQIEEVRTPDADAMIIAQTISFGLEKRLPFRRVMKQALEKIMATKEAKGAKIVLAGRLGGNEMARREEVKKGGIPLQFIRGDIDFARYRANLPYGVIGIKVWIYKGDSLEQK